MTVIDFSASFPRAADIRAAGHEGVVCYVSPARETWMKAKPLTKAVADSYKAAGLKIATVWQYGGAGNPDVMRGAAGGRADAVAADAQLKAAGLPGHPVFFAVDFDITLTQWNATAVAYFRAAVEVLGRQRVGIYGHSRVVAWAQEDGVVADLGGGRCLGWVTRSWSAGETGSGYAALYQRVHNTPGPSGVQIDINDVYSTSPFSAPSTPPKETPVTDAPYDVDMSSQFSFGGPRPTSGISRIVLHTTESPLGTPAENVAAYQIRSQSGSYHYLVDSTGKRVRCNTDDWTTWSTGNNEGNWQGLNLSFVCYSAQTRDQWLAQEKMLRAGATIAAAWAKKYNIPLVKTDGTSRGFCGHGDLRRYGGTDHTDPGSAFPWDIFLGYVREAMAAPAADNKEESTVSNVDIIAAVNKYTGDYIKGFCGPIGSDVKDIREQLTGGRNAGEYPGWPQLGQNTEGKNLTLVDALAAARQDIAAQQQTINAMRQDIAALTSLVKDAFSAGK